MGYHGTPHPSCGCPLPGSKGCDCDCPTGTPPVTCGCGTPRSVILLASAKKDASLETLGGVGPLVGLEALLLAVLADGDDLDQSVQLLLGLLVVVTLARQPDPDALGHVLHALSPHSLVKAHVHTHVGSLHRQPGELLDNLHSLGRLLLEGGAVEALVQVDGVIAGDHVSGAPSSPCSSFCHVLNSPC